MHRKLCTKALAKESVKDNFKFTFIHINFFRNQKKFTIEPKSYTAMLQHLFRDSTLSTFPKKKNETEEWPKATASPLLFLYQFLKFN